MLLLRGCLLLAIGLSLCGCGSVAPLDARWQEFAYPPETLAEEIIPRLQAARSQTASPVRNPRADEVAQMEADRGSDGDRPDPISVDAVVSDAAAKLRQMAKISGDKVGLEILIDEIKSASGLEPSLRDEFVQKLQAAMEPVAN